MRIGKQLLRALSPMTQGPGSQASLLFLIGAAAGGGFRSTLGRAIFMTSCVCQSILKPDIVINKVNAQLVFPGT